MSSRLIEECFEDEKRQEEEYSRYITLQVSKTTMIIYDPFAINSEDLKNIKPGRIIFVRARRPIWGQGDLHRYIHKIEV